METAESRASVERTKSPEAFALLLVALASTAAVTPFVFFGNASGHDIQFHLSSWMDVAGQWREGILYPRWAEWANWGFGEPRFIFYPPLSWMTGAALGSLLPWNAVPGAYTWLALAVAGTAMWKFAREWLPEQQAAAAGALFALNPYNLAVIYYRSDFAELLAVAFLPLLLWGAWHVTRGEWRRVPHLAVVFAAIWLSNAPEGVIATYSLALLLFANCIRRRTLQPIFLGGSAMIAGFGLAAFYILPAARERNWVQISQALAANLSPEQNFLFTHSNDPEFQLFNWKISSVALGMIVVAFVAAVCAARRRREFREIRWMLLALGAVSVLFMFPLSALLWRYLPELAFLQFPWRWLGPLAVVFAFFVVAAIGLLRPGASSRLATTIVIAAIGTTGVLIATSTWWNSEDASFLAGEIRSGHGYEGVDEYEPLRSDRYALPGATPDAVEVPAVAPTPPVTILDAASGTLVPASAVKLNIKQWSSERKVFSAETAQPATLALRLINYPAWEIRVDGTALPASSAPETAQMLLPLAPGVHEVEVDLRRTPDRAAGGASSIVAAIGLLGFGWIGRRRASPLG